ncbi:TAXI family TRAP transporter solute-binding subunit [Pelagibacterium mangrovi]|uniref:TAXI family TRAP transporter solute-binding subunit n=1 Tax=Pelagibacterium mangrovi TaxID=3119828 RepID=UPI002FCAF28A
MTLLKSFAPVAALVSALGVAAPTVAQDQPAEFTFQCGTLGSVAYTVGNAMQEMFADNQDVRIISAEGAGATAATVNLMNNPAWKSSIGCTTVLDHAYARLGVEPFFAEAVDISGDVKVLFNYLYAAVGFVTTDDELNAVSDLDGMTVAAGRRGQANWGGIPAMMVENGLPAAEVSFEFLGTDPSHEAVSDGRMSTTATQVPVFPDGSKAFTPGVLSKLIASGRDLHPLSFTEEHFENARAAGLPFQSITLAPGVLPIETDEPVTWVFSPGMITVNKDFPEEAAYEIVRTMIDRAEELPDYQALLETIATPARLLGQTTRAELHPGAARAFEEAGLLD